MQGHDSTAYELKPVDYDKQFDVVLRPFCRLVKGVGGNINQLVYDKQGNANPVSILDIRLTDSPLLIMTAPYYSLPFEKAPQELLDDLDRGSKGSMHEGNTTSSVTREAMERAIQQEVDKLAAERKKRRNELIEFAAEKAFKDFDGRSILVPCTRWGKFASWFDVDFIGLRLVPLMNSGASYGRFYLCINSLIDAGRRGNPIQGERGEAIGAPLELRTHKPSGVRYVYPLHEIAFRIYSMYRQKDKLVKPEIPVITGLDFFIDRDESKIIHPTMEQLEKIFSRH
jgi:hypothetical protein